MPDGEFTPAVTHPREKLIGFLHRDTSRELLGEQQPQGDPSQLPGIPEVTIQPLPALPLCHPHPLAMGNISGTSQEPLGPHPQEPLFPSLHCQEKMGMRHLGVLVPV